MSDPSSALLADLVGQPVTGMRQLQGGDLSEVRLLTLADGSHRVAKLGSHARAEAGMLEAMARTGAPVPKVLEVRPLMLILEHLPESHALPGAWGRLGRRLRAMHDAPAPEGAGYGWPEDYAFGPVPIPCGLPGEAPGTATDWPRFWAEARLLQGIETLPMPLARRIEALAQRLPDMLPAAPRPSLLHGDLWAGNLLFGPSGNVHLIDPACARGDAEVDLAMLHLFGQPGPGFTANYGSLPPGWGTRRVIYQLWPALVHLRLFGPSYRTLVEDLLDRL
ncbi:fructosamine kinase family protein [Pseudooceanicola marinus]|uniref:fructosamine kinase family protein n=1 Tax=Pseudooceanicola marinus TaxID=396013 RepID=UPI001CD7F9D3|nr:fructosamine kinase family protein [Pseudooceanicola marinus]MCA1336744.1 fructosamine kinase family protein [Pseudooceanicola marinus]